MLRAICALMLSEGCAAPVQIAPSPPPPSDVVLVFGGDVMLGRYIGERWRAHGGDDPFRSMPQLSLADLSVVNLETAICEAGPVRSTKRDVFAAPPSAARLIAEAGIDWVSLANNHALDCGPEGLKETKERLLNEKVTAVGLGDGVHPVGLKGVEVVIVAATDRYARPCLGEDCPTFFMVGSSFEAGTLEAVSRAREETPRALVVAFLHWGREGVDEPDPAQVSTAHALIDAGANMVVGHHSHVLQRVERYGDGLIAYSLGNLLFDMRRPESALTGLLEVRLRAREDQAPKIVGVVLHPLVWAGDQTGPEVADGEPGLVRFVEASEDAGLTWVLQDGLLKALEPLRSPSAPPPDP